jgi:NAD binding domain of 6-phosphogluconate dehydrogenase/NAD-binding of NADP-dependent 3-hydroxyisobutyrate dehydrogenase
VAERSDLLLSILPAAAAVEQVVCGPHGTLTALRPGTVHIEMSTVDVAAKGRIRDAVRERGGDMLDAPISGSPGMVGPRLATTFASGDPASIERARPVLDAIAGPWVHTGEFGTGAAMEYVASMLLAAHTVAAAEALAFARRAGLDLVQAQSTLDKSIAALAILAQRGPVMRPDPRPDRRSGVHSGRDTMNWSLATYRRTDTIGLAVLRADGSLVEPPDLKQWASAVELLDDWARAEPVLRGLDIDAAPVIEHDALLAPVRWPRKVICAGVNYRRHVAEMGGTGLSDTTFDRDIDFRGDRFTERITLAQPHRVVFTRIAGPVLGTFANGSAAEQEYADAMTGDYLKAVGATLNAMRRLSEEPAGAPA